MQTEGALLETDVGGYLYHYVVRQGDKLWPMSLVVTLLLQKYTRQATVMS